MGIPLAVLVAAVVIVALVFRSAAPTPAAAALPPGTWKIGLDAPLSGVAESRGLPMENAIKLALKDVNAGAGIFGSHLGLAVYDDGGTSPSLRDRSRVMRASSARMLRSIRRISWIRALFPRGPS